VAYREDGHDAVDKSGAVHRSRRRRLTAPLRPDAADVHPLLRARADRQLGIFTAADARSAGYQHPEIRTLISSGEWRRLRHGIYVTAEDLAAIEAAGRLHRVECLAVLLALGRPEAAISSVSAARLWRLPVRRDLPRTVRLTDPRLWRRGRGFQITEAPLPPGDVVTAGPVRLTSIPRTLIDCAREWPLEDAVIAMDAALLAEHLTPAQLAEAATAARHRRGVTRATRAVGLSDGRAESALESRGRLRLVGAGLAPDALQVEIRTGGRLVGVVDAWYHEAAVAVEFDGRVKYTDPWRGRTPERVLWEEKRREDELRALDIRFLRVADADVGAGWPRVESRLRDLLATPGPSSRRFTATARPRGRLRAG
jgi:Transcriptional regulator, AbiEi antitoxin